MSLLGIDIGTTGCKAVIFNRYGEILSAEYREHPLIHPRKGWVELDPDLIWNNIKDLVRDAGQKIKKDKIEAGITVNKIIAIGGGAKSREWLKIKSDILNRKILTLKNQEAASLGAAMLAGIAVGEYSSYKNAVENTVKKDKIYCPDSNRSKQYDIRYSIYKDIYSKNKNLLHRISKLD